MRVLLCCVMSFESEKFESVNRDLEMFVSNNTVVILQMLSLGLIIKESPRFQYLVVNVCVLTVALFFMIFWFPHSH